MLTVTNFFRWLADKQPQVSFVFHIGARTDTTEFDYEVHRKLNLEYSKKVWKYCAHTHTDGVCFIRCYLWCRRTGL